MSFSSIKACARLGVMTRNVDNSEAHLRALARASSPRLPANRSVTVLKTAVYGGAALKAEAVEECWKEL